MMFFVACCHFYITPILLDFKGCFLVNLLSCFLFSSFLSHFLDGGKIFFYQKTPTTWCGIPPELGPPNDQGIHPSRARPEMEKVAPKNLAKDGPCELRKKKRPDTIPFHEILVV